MDSKKIFCDLMKIAILEQYKISVSKHSLQRMEERNISAEEISNLLSGDIMAYDVLKSINGKFIRGNITDYKNTLTVAVSIDINSKIVSIITVHRFVKPFMKKIIRKRLKQM